MSGHFPTIARRRLATALSVCWLLATAYAFWWFQLRNLQPFDPDAASRTVLFEARQINTALSALLSDTPVTADADRQNMATVIHFWDPACPCSRFNERHVRDIVSGYRDRGIRFVVIARAGHGLTHDALATRARAAFGDAVQLMDAPTGTLTDLTPSSPATAILDAEGELAYFGPYSTGALCTSTTGVFAERVLDQLLLGHNPQQWNTWASGCFCSWNRRA
jgi:hypothetical protein